MSKQVSPFAALTGAEKQIRWLEYQSIRLPYIHAGLEDSSNACTEANKMPAKQSVEQSSHSPAASTTYERPQPPPEVPRILPNESKSRHSQYDAVVARLKQAELQSRRYGSQTAQQIQQF